MNRAEYEEYLALVAEDIIGDLMNLRVINADVPPAKLDTAALYIKRRLQNLEPRE
jgi:hypothetical protein